MAQKQPLLNLITRPRFRPVSLSLSMVTLTKPAAVTQWHNNCLIIPRSRVRVHPPLVWSIYAIQGQYYRDFTRVDYNCRKRKSDTWHYMYDSMHLNYFVTTVNYERRIFSNEMTLSITTLRIAIRKCDTQHNDLLCFAMLIVFKVERKLLCWVWSDPVSLFCESLCWVFWRRFTALTRMYSHLNADFHTSCKLQIAHRCNFSWNYLIFMQIYVASVDNSMYCALPLYGYLNVAVES